MRLKDICHSHYMLQALGHQPWLVILVHRSTGRIKRMLFDTYNQALNFVAYEGTPEQKMYYDPGLNFFPRDESNADVLGWDEERAEFNIKTTDAIARGRCDYSNNSTYLTEKIS